MKKKIGLITALFLIPLLVIAGTDPSNTFRLGDGSASNKSILFNKGGSNPVIRWNNSAGYFDMSYDGVTFTQISAAGNQANYFANGNFDLWQRGTSTASVAPTSEIYLPDRWRFVNELTAAASANILQSTTVPTSTQSGFNSVYSYRINVSANDNSLGASEFAGVEQVMEGYDWAYLKGNQVTVQFWVRSTITGTYSFYLQNSGRDRSYVTNFSISSANTWEQKTGTLTLNPTGGTDDFDSDAGMYFGIALAAGSGFQTTAGAWQTGDRRSTSSNTNFFSAGSPDIFLSQMKLSVFGAASTYTYKGGTLATEVQNAGRFYQKSYNIGVSPGTATTAGNEIWVYAIAGATQGTQKTVRLSPPMRTAPDAHPYNPVSGTIDNVRAASSNVAASATLIGDRGFSIDSSSPGDGDVVSSHWTADAEFY